VSCEEKKYTRTTPHNYNIIRRGNKEDTVPTSEFISWNQTGKSSGQRVGKARARAWGCSIGGEDLLRAVIGVLINERELRVHRRTHRVLTLATLGILGFHAYPRTGNRRARQYGNACYCLLLLLIRRRPAIVMENKSVSTTGQRFSNEYYEHSTPFNSTTTASRSFSNRNIRSFLPFSLRSLVHGIFFRVPANIRSTL